MTALLVMFAGFCTLIALYWLVVGSAGARGGVGLQLLVLILGLATASALGAAVLAGRRETRVPSAVVVGAVGLAILAALGPFLLMEWRGGDRYIWVIQQGYPCDSMGSGPGALWVFATSWLFALAALGYAWVAEATLRQRLAGLVLGAVLVALTFAAMFPDPRLFAWLLGCL